MKFFNYYLSIFISIALIVSAKASSIKKSTNDLTSTSLTFSESLAKELLQDTDFSGMFWKQIYEPGKDPEKFIRETDRFNKYEYLVVDNESMRFTPDKTQVNRVTNQLYLHDIYDPDKDNAKDGKCCTRVTFYEFPEPQCVGKKCILERQKLKQHPPTQDQLDKDPVTARFCIHIFIYHQLSWRICHRNKDSILKLKNTISFGVLKTIPGINPSEIMKKYIQHSTNSPLMAPDSWNWHDQKAWGGNCDVQVMQSPINIIAPVSGSEGSTSIDFKIEYKFEKNVPFYITNNGIEVVLKFTSFAGAFKIIYASDGSMLSFQPHTMAFRFPAEHLINGFRMDGEIVLYCSEISPSDNKAISLTNGMEFSVPLKFHPDAPIYKEFSSLFPEMWRKELDDDDDKEYRPRDAITGKYVNFDFHGFMTRVMNLKSDFSMYLGTQTTPPCKDHVLQIVGNTPLVMKNCQFKDIRENTLLSEATKETHARALQFNPNGGKNVIKNLKFAQFVYQGNLHNFTPERKFASVEIKRPGSKKGVSALKRKIVLFGKKKGCELEKTTQLPHYERLTRRRIR